MRSSRIPFPIRECKMVHFETRRDWATTTDLRIESSYVEDGWLHVLVGLKDSSTVADAMPIKTNRPADFMKTAGERKPHFIKCGFGEAAEMAVDLEVA